jgi:hypothetical protein
MRLGSAAAYGEGFQGWYKPGQRGGATGWQPTIQPTKNLKYINFHNAELIDRARYGGGGQYMD